MIKNGSALKRTGDKFHMSHKKKIDPEDMVSILFDDLILNHNEIGIHRGREHGFRDVFGFRTLYNLPFVKLAKKVKKAYEGEDVPKHKGWPAQREALQWFVDKGHEALYQFKDHVRVSPGPGRTYYILGGNHRALALYILGSSDIRAIVEED
jgi:hypothetical protein